MTEPPLVDFDSPPVVEVALALSTGYIPQLTSSHFAMFWQESLRDRYPVSEDHPPIPSTVGAPDSYSMTSAPLQIVVEPSGLTRQWYLSRDATRLVQLQQGRLVLNWRKLETDTYPRFSTLRRELELVFRQWNEFLVREGFAPAHIGQTELTYVNHIPSRGTEDPISFFDAVSLSWPKSAGRPSGFQFEQRFEVGDANAPAAGHVYVSFAPFADLSSGASGFALNLVFRGRGGDTLDDVFANLDLGHMQIVRTFADMLTKDARDAWGYR